MTIIGEGRLPPYADRRRGALPRGARPRPGARHCRVRRVRSGEGWSGTRGQRRPLASAARTWAIHASTVPCLPAERRAHTMTAG